MTYKQISMDEAKQIFESGVDGSYIILDVRSEGEFAEGHIPGAINVANESIGAETPAELQDKNQLIYVYCRSGNRSKQAAEKHSFEVYGVAPDAPECIHTVDEAIEYINEIGFLPLFKNEIPGFSLEERTVSEDWWSENPDVDSWEWRAIIARTGQSYESKSRFIEWNNGSSCIAADECWNWKHRCSSRSNEGGFLD